VSIEDLPCYVGMPTCGIFQKCDISAAGSVARVHPDRMAAIFVLSSLSWLNRVLWDWNLTHCLGVIRQGNYMVAEANDKFLMLFMLHVIAYPQEL